MARLFGTDGVRGEANIDLTPELAYRLGRAATIFFGEHTKEQPLLLIGRDTRISGPMFEASLAAGICSAGGRALIIGVIPTPAIAYLTKKLGAQAGIVISASHNPYMDNGIKFFGGNGYKLPDDVEDQLEASVHAIEEGTKLFRPTGGKIGVIEDGQHYMKDYIEFVKATVKTDFRGIKIVLDCANGAAWHAMPKVLEGLGADVVVLNNEPNGVNINNNCGSTHIEGLQKAVLAHKADIGIAHDGDADRCLAVDDKGEIIDGDKILVICALEMMAENRLKDNTVVSTVMANIGFHKAIKNAGGRVEVTKVGDRYVLENMLANGYVLGGEQSGHIIFSEYSTTGDGLITAIQLIASIKRSGKKASEMAGLMKSYPQLLVNVRVKSKNGWEENANIKAAIAKGNDELGDNGRILVRPSGTEQLIRVMAEGPEQKQLEEICHAIADVVKAEQG
jgi:phosphoglucosamine mutase